MKISASAAGRIRRAALPAGLVMALLGVALPAAATGLQPYQMSRSLQLVQDRIADGDHAAMPMQTRLIEMIDERLRRADAEVFEDKRNFDALLIYGMSGGNPATFEVVLSRLELEETSAQLANGVKHYASGNLSAAREAFAELDLDRWSPAVAAFAALVKGSVMAGSEPESAVAYFDQARLLSPGTLVEEAALRRAIALHAGAMDHDRFMRAASQYARRFLRSPYASQYAQSLVSGITAMFDHIDRRAIDDALSWMTHEQAQTIYLRLARQAAIDGHDSMLEFASAKARQMSSAEEGGNSVRSLLYSSIASVTSDTVDSVVYQLRQIDRNRLSPEDLELLNAAEAIAAEVVARPQGSSPLTDLPEAGNSDAEAIPATMSADGAAPAMIDATPSEMRTDDLITSARDKLESIDRMLKDGNQ
ncbi:chemotaxis protein [Chelativorans sp. ZYF759]|uniref:chemotaxis protein n=1 Tax=Chelativorans sp. ZYF759 TaxID=2692213 RepID=UPI00145EFA34|nr:chemotaxis protein [Chelativorans sp. ZYF759]NMG40328.1 chemotaxis protein [Chelativorans sp. ZYF759]